MSSELPVSPHLSSPLCIYRHDLELGIIVSDLAQARAIDELQIIYQHLSKQWCGSGSWWFALKARLGLVKTRAVPGLYLWGGVGRGKTYMMDLFYHSLPGNRKMRMHFHRFMQMVHEQLHAQSGHSNPLNRVGLGIAAQVDIICFDEFFVADIGDAMILAGLLETLFTAGVILVTTSNILPDALYANGLQRQKFLPAIKLLQQFTKVINVDGGIDYRLRSLDKAAVYHYPLTRENDCILSALYADLARGQHSEADKIIEIQGRLVKTKFWSEGLVWFDFENLCGGPRGAADYIELAQQYHTVFVSGIEVLHEEVDDKVRRFITMVDEFYDHQVKLVVTAAVSLHYLYQGRDLSSPFARTQSRMIEMQTREYLGSPHNPD